MEVERGPVLFVPAHPDDETVGASAALAGAASDLLLMYVTDGAPRNMFDARNYGFETRDEYAAARRLELENALELAGVAPEQVLMLGVADQEASLDMEAMARKLAAAFEEIRPREVWTHPYEGGHPDHDAAAFAVHLAARLAGERAPRLMEFTSYHAKGNGVAVFEFLQGENCRETTVTLSPAECGRKARMIECFRTQAATLSMFPVGIERSRPAPRYDFRRPPHEGQLHYERYDWGMAGERWRELADAALEALGQ